MSGFAWAALAGWALLGLEAFHVHREHTLLNRVAEERMASLEMETLAQNLLNRAKLRLEYDAKTGRQRYHFEVQYNKRNPTK